MEQFNSEQQDRDSDEQRGTPASGQRCMSQKYWFILSDGPSRANQTYFNASGIFPVVPYVNVDVLESSGTNQ
jgi:hypothetical protein